MSKKALERFINLFGWYGTVVILVAYALLTLGRMQADSFWYVFLNLSGSIGLTWEAWRKRDNPLVVLNLAWAAVALVGLYKAFA